MEFIFLIGGVLVGAVFTFIFTDMNKTHGVIQVDHNINACKILLTSDELSNLKSKKAIFKIDHKADLSREEQIL